MDSASDGEKPREKDSVPALLVGPAEESQEGG